MPSEFRSNHIIDSINIPLHNIEKITSIVPLKDTYIFVYCSSGLISEKAQNKLRKIGYKNAYNMGGIYKYTKYIYIE